MLTVLSDSLESRPNGGVGGWGRVGVWREVGFLQKKVLGPLWSGTFPPPRLSLLCSPVSKSKTQPTRSSFGGPEFFLEGALSGTFPPPIHLHPPYHGPKISRHSDGLSLRGFGGVARPPFARDS